MLSYTTGDYLAGNPDWHTADSPWKAGQVVRMLERHGLAPGRVVEVGCGAGGILKALARARTDIRSLEGYDIAPEAVAMAASGPEPRVAVHCADILAEADRLVAQAGGTPPFDLLLVMDVAEHVPDPLAFLGRLRPLARHTILHLPLDMSVFGLLKGLPMQRRATVGHLHYFSKDTALATVADAGYRVVDWFYTPAALDKASAGDSAARRLVNMARRGLFGMAPDRTVLLLGGFSLLVLATPDGRETPTATHDASATA